MHDMLKSSVIDDKEGAARTAVGLYATSAFSGTSRWFGSDCALLPDPFL